MEHHWKRVTAGPNRALVVVILVVLMVLAAVSVAPRAVAATAGPGGEGSAPAGVWPLSPGPDQVVHGFDPPACTWCPGHRGVDLAGSAGVPVRAVFAGTVSYAGALAGRDVVVVDQGSERTEYEPVVPTVRRGAVVAAGTVIGHLAVIGSHCFPAACLHLGLIRDSDDAYLDPMSLFAGVPGPVRLLPLGTTPSASVAPAAPRTANPPRSVITGWVPLIVLAAACQARGWACW